MIFGNISDKTKKGGNFWEAARISLRLSEGISLGRNQFLVYDVNFIKYYPVGECLAQTLVDHYSLLVEVDKEGWRVRRLSRCLFCIVNISGTRRRGQGDKVHTGRGE